MPEIQSIGNQIRNPEPITEELFRQVYKYEDVEKPTACDRIKEEIKCSKNTIFNLFPILSWLPAYKFKEYFVGDLIAGITVSIMHIPHGLAYGPLGGQEPVVGLYMAVFPTMIYLLMGTSRHISLGTFAILTMMTGQTVFKYIPMVEDDLLTPGLENGTSNGTDSGHADERFSAIQVGVAISLMVGLWQFILGVFRLGVLSVLLSNSLVSGFTTGAAVHVASVQFKNLLGVDFKTRPGPLKLVYGYIDLFSNITKTNLVTLGISISFILFLSTFNEVIKPLINKKFPKCKVPVPIELISILLGIIISYALDLKTNYNVKIVSRVPSGLPEPIVPPFQLLPEIIVDSFIIAIIAISVNLSLAKIFAKKSEYKIYGNQELLAYGAANMFGAFFQCIPVAASLSRSLVQHSTGGKTALANIFSIILIILILLFMGPIFEPVPLSVLSAIVIVTLKGLLMQVTDFPKMYRKSKLDGLVWLATFLGVCIIDLDYGLGVGMVTSFITMLLRSQKTRVSVLGRVPDTNIYLDVEHFKTAATLPGIIIMQIIGGLHFANIENVQNKVIGNYKKFEEISLERNSSSLVLNMASVSYLDPTAVSGLFLICRDLKKFNCTLYLTDCIPSVYKTMRDCDFFKDFPKEQVLASVYDAVEYLSKESKNDNKNE